MEFSQPHTSHCKGCKEHSHHTHHHQASMHGKKLLTVTLLNFFITLVEIIGGLLSNSLSLLSDAVHNLGDTLALFFAFIAHKIGNKKADMQLTFGYKRVEILTAFFNALLLIIICLFLFREAYMRLLHPEPVKGLLMLAVALAGLAANWISVIILQKDKNKNINVKAAYLHLLGDTLSSVAVIAGGIAIWLFNVIWVDPLITILVGLYIIYHTWEVLKDAIGILMQSAPKNMDIQHIISQIKSIPGVKDIHHLHLWQLNEEQIHFEAHINVTQNIDMVHVTNIRHAIEHILLENNIRHTTLQIGYNCCDGNEKLIVDENI